jgi:hypothetical protein
VYLTNDHRIQYSIPEKLKNGASHNLNKAVDKKTNRKIRAPWVDRMPKNVLTPIKNWSELDSCLIRGFTHTATWLIRAGYFGGPNLPLEDVEFFLHRTILHGDLTSFLSILRSPMKIRLNDYLIDLISSLDSFPHESGDFTSAFRQWVPCPIEPSLRMLRLNGDSEAMFSRPSPSLVRSLCQLAHDAWALGANQGAPLVVQKGGAVCESALTVPFERLDIRKQRQMEKMALQTLRSIEVLGFTLERLDIVESNIRLDVDHNGFSHLGETRSKLNIENGKERQGRPKMTGALEKLRNRSAQTSKLRRTSVFESARRTNDFLKSVRGIAASKHARRMNPETVPTTNDLRRLMETLSMNVHDSWANNKKKKRLDIRKLSFE